MAERDEVPPDAIRTVDGHPNRAAIREILTRAPQITDPQLERLAKAWNQSRTAQHVRNRAWDAGSPLVVDALRSWERINAIFGDDISGAVPHPTLTVSRVRWAVNAIHDAVAVTFAAPVLTPGQYRTLREPWDIAMRGFPPAAAEPYGSRTQEITHILDLALTAATGCHDRTSRTLLNQLHDAACVYTERERTDARTTAYETAVLHGRHRQWHAIRHNLATPLTVGCLRCANQDVARELHRGIKVAADAACAWLVADVAPEPATGLLIQLVQDVVKPAA